MQGGITVTNLKVLNFVSSIRDLVGNDLQALNKLLQLLFLS